MTVYIEYALIENFVYDYVLLRLAFFAAREKTKWYKAAFSALVGAVFALLCPLLSLPPFLFLCLKIAVGLLLCLLAFGRLKTKKEWGRYAFTALCFFFLTFGYGGAMQAFSGKTSLPPQTVFVGFACLSLATLWGVRKWYEKRGLHAFIYPCTLTLDGREVSALGFYDSGNVAQKNGVPICFVSPEILYALLGENWWQGGGTVRDETQISTLSGVKNVTLYKGEISLRFADKKQKKTDKKTVYFSPSKNIISREYKVLLSAALIGE